MGGICYGLLVVGTSFTLVSRLLLNKTLDKSQFVYSAFVVITTKIVVAWF